MFCVHGHFFSNWQGLITLQYKADLRKLLGLGLTPLEVLGNKYSLFKIKAAEVVMLHRTRENDSDNFDIVFLREKIIFLVGLIKHSEMISEIKILLRSVKGLSK